MSVYSFIKKTNLGLSFLRSIYTFINPIQNKIFSFKLRFFRFFTYNKNSKYLALGERLEYNFPNHWIKVDYLCSDFEIDLKKVEKFPFKSGTFRGIFSAHCFEHLGFKAVNNVLKECYRILEKGGGIRIDVPNADIFVKAYLENDEEFLLPFIKQASRISTRFDLAEKEQFSSKHIAVMNCISHFHKKMRSKNEVRYYSPMIPKLVEKDLFDNQLMSLPRKDFYKWAANLQTEEELSTGGHQCGFNFEILKEMLEKNGFREIREVKIGSSRFRDFGINYEKNISKKIFEKESRAHFNLIVEAVK